MIHLSNDHSFEFACASGALGFFGEGWLWERPMIRLGLIDPSMLTVIAKTVTFTPRKGNLNMFHPWTCVRLIPGGVVNAVGLTNPGFRAWCEKAERVIWSNPGLNLIASIAPGSKAETLAMINRLNRLDIRAVEINPSCPNVCADDQAQHIVEIVETAYEQSSHPLVLKLAHDQAYVDICNALCGKIEAVDLINAVQWKKLYSNPSPLAKYRLEGGVSGQAIVGLAREALNQAVKNTSVPVLSGGGIISEEEVKTRFEMGASAVAFGTMFLRQPVKPKQIIKTLTKEQS